MDEMSFISRKSPYVGNTSGLQLPIRNTPQSFGAHPGQRRLNRQDMRP